MSQRFGHRLLVVWLALSGVTLAQLAVGWRGATSALTPNATITTGAIVIALVKVRLIMREFMEVREAPVLLQRLTDVWVLVTGVSLLGAYHLGMALAAR